MYWMSGRLWMGEKADRFPIFEFYRCFFRPIQPDFGLFCKYLFLVWLRKLLKFVASSFFHIEIAAACAGSQRPSSSKLQAWKVAVAAVIIGAEYFCQLRAAKSRKVFDMRMRLSAPKTSMRSIGCGARKTLLHR